MLKSLIALAGAAILTLGVTVLATAGDSGLQGGSFLGHIHELAQRLHGGGHHDEMGQLIEQLELTPEQQQRLERIHEVIASVYDHDDNSMLVLHDELVRQFEDGDIKGEAIHRTIDDQLEQLRGVAYAVTDELVGLVNDLDERQHGIVLEHLKGSDEGHGH